MSQLFKVIALAKCVLTILELNWNQRFWDNKTKLNMSSYAHVVQTTAKQVISRRRKSENVFKMSKEKNARAKRAKIPFFIVKYANLWGFCCRRRRGCLSSLKIWRRQRQRHKSVISLVEWRKIIVLRVWHAFWCNLPNDDVKFSYLRFWRKRELDAVNLSFSAFTWKPFVPSKRKYGSPILYNVINM